MSADDRAERRVENYLHEQIPLSAAMQVAVLVASGDAVELRAPLAPNINHKSTAFGGSIATLGILAAWSLLHVRLLEAGLAGEVVIQSSHVDYDKPVTGSFTARSSLADDSRWAGFTKMLARKKMARIEVGSVVTSGGITVARFQGKFVAFLNAE
ncbi:MAG: thioesterase domain-containing protein [Novosphingobium sp.]